MRGHRGKHIPAVEGVAARRKPILRVRQLEAAHHRLGGRGKTQEPIVRSNEDRVAGLEQERAPRTAYPRVHHRDMDRAGRKEGRGAP